VRFGYRRLLVLLRREGWDLGKKRLYRVYTEEGLALRPKRPWRHATAVHREQRRPSTQRNDIWSMDFVADELADGRRFRALTVIDLFTRECLAIDVGHGLCGRDVVATLERLRFARGLPQRIYCDNGTEFVSAAMDLWAYTNTVILDSVAVASRPTTPQSNRSMGASGRNASTSTGSNLWRMHNRRSMHFDGITMSIILTELSRVLALVNTLGKR
jgi:putative transposase